MTEPSLSKKDLDIIKLCYFLIGNAGAADGNINPLRNEDKWEYAPKVKDTLPAKYLDQKTGGKAMLADFRTLLQEKGYKVGTDQNNVTDVDVASYNDFVAKNAKAYTNWYKAEAKDFALYKERQAFDKARAEILDRNPEIAKHLAAPPKPLAYTKVDETWHHMMPHVITAVPERAYPTKFVWSGRYEEKTRDNAILIPVATSMVPATGPEKYFASSANELEQHEWKALKLAKKIGLSGVNAEDSFLGGIDRRFASHAAEINSAKNKPLIRELKNALKADGKTVSEGDSLQAIDVSALKALIVENHLALDVKAGRFPADDQVIKGFSYKGIEVLYDNKQSLAHTQRLQALGITVANFPDRPKNLRYDFSNSELNVLAQSIASLQGTTPGGWRSASPEIDKNTAAKNIEAALSRSGKPVEKDGIASEKEMEAIVKVFEENKDRILENKGAFITKRSNYTVEVTTRGRYGKISIEPDHLNPEIYPTPVPNVLKNGKEIKR